MRRTPLGLLIVLGILLTIVISVHGYFAARLIDDTQLPAPWSTLGRCTVWGLGSLLFLHPILSRRLAPKLGRLLAWPAYVWLGASLYLLIAFGISDLVLAVSGWSGLAVMRERALWVLAVAGVVTARAMRNALRVPSVRRVEVALPGWPEQLDGYRIVQISDVHIGSILRARFARGIAERCNALDADLIAITGDLVDGSVAELGPHVEPLRALRARDGVYFVTGNHDHYSGADAWVQWLESVGIHVLRNRRVAIERGRARFELAGVDDLSSRRSGPLRRGFDLDAALSGWQREGPLVLLAHDPRTFELARQQGVSLQLSGHTHDGQIWPFRYLVRLQTRWLAGLYRDGVSALYVSRGTGFWGPPMRFLAPHEITELVLRGIQSGVSAHKEAA